LFLLFYHVDVGFRVANKIWLLVEIEEQLNIMNIGSLRIQLIPNERRTTDN